MQVELKITAYGRDEVKAVAETLGHLANHMPDRDPYASSGSTSGGTAVPIGPAVPNTLTDGQTGVVAVDKPARTRRTRAQIEADNAAEAARAISQTPEDRQDPAAEPQVAAATEEDDDIFGANLGGTPVPAAPKVRTADEIATFVSGEVKPALQAVINKYGTDKAKEVIAQFGGAAKLADVKPDLLDALLQAAKAAAA